MHRREAQLDRDRAQELVTPFALDRCEREPPRESHLLIASADQRQKPQSSSYRTVTRGRSATPEPQSPSEPPVPSVRAKLSIAASSCIAASEEALPLSTSSAI